MVETRKRKSSKKSQTTEPDSEADDFQPSDSGDEYEEGSSSGSKSRFAAFNTRQLDLNRNWIERKRAQPSGRGKGKKKAALADGVKATRSKATSSKKAGGKRRATLELMLEMPLDVIYEVGQMSTALQCSQIQS
jgi:hypothetical protein